MFANDNELFYYSLYYRLICAIVIILASATVGILDVIYPVPIASLWFPLGGLLIGVYFAVTLLRSGVFSADFFENHFEVRVWRFERSFAYSDIKDVVLIKPKSSGAGMSITVKDQNQSFVVGGNPRNKQLDTDLYSWLNKKRLDRSSENIHPEK